MDDDRLMLDDATWARLRRAIAAAKAPAGAPPSLADRDFVEAVLYRARAGCPWRDLPARFGPWGAVYQRFRRWERTGVWLALFAALPADLAAVAELCVDSTVVRAHQHAAGAPKKRGARPRRGSGGAGAA